MRCTKQDKMYGDTFIARFSNDIFETFEWGDCDKDTKTTADTMELDLQRIYPENYALHWVTEIKSSVSQLTNKKWAWEIIDFDDMKSSSRRRGRKVLYIKNYVDELKTCFSKNVMVFKSAHAVVWLKDKPP